MKHFFREKSTPKKDPITGQDMNTGTLEIRTKKPITPSQAERKKSSGKKCPPENRKKNISFFEK